jgi:hypothetical protein
MEAKMHKNFMTVLLLMTIFSLSSMVQGQSQSWNFNIKGGMLMPGTVSVEGFEVDTDMGWIANAAFDALLAEKISMGGYFFYAGTSAEESDETANIMTIGGTIKARFTLQGGTQIRPGVILAYQMTTGEAFDDVNGLNVGFTGEVAFPLKNKNAIVTEIGFTSQPSGGNEDAEVTWAPIFYLTVGYEFGG